LRYHLLMIVNYLVRYHSGVYIYKLAHSLIALSCLDPEGRRSSYPPIPPLVLIYCTAIGFAQFMLCSKNTFPQTVVFVMVRWLIRPHNMTFVRLISISEPNQTQSD